MAVVVDDSSFREVLALILESDADSISNDFPALMLVSDPDSSFSFRGDLMVTLLPLIWSTCKILSSLLLSRVN